MGAVLVRFFWFAGFVDWDEGRLAGDCGYEILEWTVGRKEPIHSRANEAMRCCTTAALEGMVGSSYGRDTVDFRSVSWFSFLFLYIQ